MRDRIGSTFQSGSIVCRCIGSISSRYAFIVQIILLEEFTQLSVTSVLHHLKLAFRPRIHCHTSHKADVDSHTSMQACAVHTDVNAVSDTCPLRLSGTTIETSLVFFLLFLQLLENHSCVNLGVLITHLWTWLIGRKSLESVHEKMF